MVVQEVFPDGLVAQDGRLQPGDQIIEVDGVDMTSATHQAVCQALRRPNSVLRLGVYRERIEAQKALLSSPAPTTPISQAPATHQPQPGESPSFVHCLRVPFISLLTKIYWLVFVHELISLINWSCV